jgi:hypothetical protein
VLEESKSKYFGLSQYSINIIVCTMKKVRKGFKDLCPEMHWAEEQHNLKTVSQEHRCGVWVLPVGMAGTSKNRFSEREQSSETQTL